MLCIDAWLERKDPQLRLLNSDTGREHCRLSGESLEELISSGELDPAELSTRPLNDPDIIATVLRSQWRQQ
ncbi:MULTISPECIES: hypothetical protein [Spongiibacter]|nr:MULTISPECIES: hypothetical protein [Spongiibacter]MAY38282.1 hypothetical protein [Spongiibacter sp.]MBU71979.1 hypothetical protein [Spongiibacter sp.]|tara:strand:+ start:1184 stop:1396 length:213 start_codon:yes stop_codon:yes gene_type:complete